MHALDGPANLPPSVHLLLIPRKPLYYNQHPLHLFSKDPSFLAQVRTRVDRVKRLAASELRRQFGHLSASDAPYQAALDSLMSSPSPPTPEQEAALPPGRDWLAHIADGIHTHPSMSHLHIHIFSRDMHSSCMKHKKHYLSFNSSFLVHMDEFPLEEGSKRFNPGNWPNWDMKCWRCEKNFVNKFARLKEHLDDEFTAWQKE
jgi:aprataxin